MSNSQSQSVDGFINQSLSPAALFQSVYYNFDVAKWVFKSSACYYDMYDQQYYNTQAVYDLKKRIEKIPVFSEYCVVAIITAVVHRPVQNAPLNQNNGFCTSPQWLGRAFGYTEDVMVLGNMVARNRKSGKFLNFMDTWLVCEKDNTLPTSQQTRFLRGADAYPKGPQIFAKHFPQHGRQMIEAIVAQNTKAK